MVYNINKQIARKFNIIEFTTDNSASIQNRYYNGVLSESLLNIGNINDLTVENTATLHNLVVNNSAKIKSDLSMANHKIMDLANPLSDTDAVIYKMLRTKVKFVHLTNNVGEHFLNFKFHSNNSTFNFNTSNANNFIRIKTLLIGPYLPTIFSASKIIINHTSQDRTVYNISMPKIKGENIYEIIPSTYPLPVYKKIQAMYIKIDKAPNPTTIDGYIFYDIIY